MRPDELIDYSLACLLHHLCSDLYSGYAASICETRKQVLRTKWRHGVSSRTRIRSRRSHATPLLTVLRPASKLKRAGLSVSVDLYAEVIFA